MIDDPNPCDPEADDAARSEQTGMEWLEEAEVELASIPVACQALKTLPGTSALTDELRRAQKRYIQLIAAVRFAESDLSILAEDEEVHHALHDIDEPGLALKCLLRLRSGDVEGKS